MNGGWVEYAFGLVHSLLLASLVMRMVSVWGSPAGRVPGGASVFVVAGWWSVCRGELGEGGAGAGLVDDGLVVGERGEEGVDGEVVDDSGVAAAGLVDERDGVVGDECVGAAGEFEVVVQVAGGFGAGHAGEGVADGDALVEGG